MNVLSPSQKKSNCDVWTKLCLTILPHSSVMLMSASDLINSSTIPSTAILTAKIIGVVPSWDLAFKFVDRLRKRIYKGLGVNSGFLIMQLHSTTNLRDPFFFVTLINDSKCLTWKTPTASAAMAACNGVRPVMSSALQSAPTSNNTLAASVLAYLAAR